MAHSWRPDNWPKDPCEKGNCTAADCPCDKYCNAKASYDYGEMKADAMLEALRKEGKKDKGIEAVTGRFIDGKFVIGTLVFIPDDKEE